MATGGERKEKRWFLLFACASAIIAIGLCDGDVNTTRLQELMTTLARQTMMQQLVMEEHIRSSGHSGLKQIRFNKDGTRAYSTSSHIGHNLASIHDHTDHYKTIGMGEVVGVLNGVDFRTRHNDYMLLSPSKTSHDYRATDEIEYPDVPPEVTAKSSVEEQIEEMRLWFKAWAEQDKKKRDYTKYFKPILCYMEGAWTETDFGKVQEPFESDRHHISADNWYDLQEKIRYTAYTGSKDKGENYAFLPTKIIDIDLTTGEPVYAQWNYRILCHPLKRDVPLSLLWPNGEFHYRYATRQSYSDYSKTRSCRFVLNKKDQDRMYRWDILEQMMTEIPGLNNYPGEIRDESFGRDVLNPFEEEPTLLNAAYYHRFFRAAEADAMGLSLGHRGFSDRNLFVALTNHSEISPVNTARVSYAIPLEIVYLTPLHKWNPYDIKFWTEADPADTAGKMMGVLDQEGNIQNVSASGVRIFLQEIPGIRGNLRIRYPIFPVHEEGSTAYKEVEALREMVMDMSDDLELFKKAPPFGSGLDSNRDEEEVERPGITLFTSESDSSLVQTHRHNVTLTYQEYVRVKVQGRPVEKQLLSSEEEGHTHLLRLTFDSNLERYRLFRCDKAKNCWDGHDRFLYESDPDEI